MSGRSRAGRGLAARLGASAARRALAGPGAARTLVAALVVAVAAVTAVTRLTDRVDAAIVAQTAQTLGADLALELGGRPSARQQAILADAGVEVATSTRLSTALAVDDRLLRVSLRAVSANYPLAGQITLRRGATTHDVARGPPAGKIWIDNSVAARLDVAPGDTLSIGRKKLTVGALLVTAPGGGGRLFDTAPQVMMAAADLAATGLTGPGARVKYAVLIAGAPDRVAAVRAQLAPTLAPGERLVDPASANRGLAAAVDKADVFLNLAALAAVVLAGVAIALSAARHAEAQRDAIALYKTLGAAKGVLRLALVVQLALLGALGLLIGWPLGELAALALARAVQGVFAVALPGGHWWASWPAAGVAIALVAGFAWPAQRTALATPPARVLARSADAGRSARWPAYALAILATAGMAMAATGDWALTAWVLGGLAASALAFALIAAGLVDALARLRRRLDLRLSAGLRLGVDAVLRRRATVLIQAVALGLALTVIFVLVVVRGDLLAGWQTRVADDAPNRFVVNVLADQRAGIAATLTAAGVGQPRFYPVVRARLAAVDGQKLANGPALRERAGDLAKRALNLSWTDTLKADNRVIAGRWWGQSGPADVDKNGVALSIAASVARRLDIGIGATLAFDVAGQALRGRVVSVRDIDWSSLQPNFFVLTPPGALAGMPTRWITSFYLPPGRQTTMSDLVHRFPNVNVINIAALLARVEKLIARVSLAVELIFGFTLAAGFVVLVAALGVHGHARRREAAVLRALGATSALLRRAAWWESGLIAMLAAAPAAIAAQIAARLIATYALHVDYSLRPGAWLLALSAALAVITLAGVLTLGDVRRQPAWKALRAGG